MPTPAVEATAVGAVEITATLTPPGSQTPATKSRDKVVATGYRFDLGVNADGDLDDASDESANHLPGYGSSSGDPETSELKHSSGEFAEAVYHAQHLKLVLDGIGTNAGYDQILSFPNASCA